MFYAIHGRTLFVKNKNANGILQRTIMTFTVPHGALQDIVAVSTASQLPCKPSSRPHRLTLLTSMYSF